jgi:hypothetical protein
MQIFSKEQKRALEDGEFLYGEFQNEVKVACSGVYDKLIKKHWAFTSMPGLTKSTTIIKYLEESPFPFIEITGKKSIRDFLYQLCYTIDIEQPSLKRPLVVFIDDCEFLFKENDTMNIFKVGIGKQRRFTYSNDAALTGLNKMKPDIKKRVLKYRLKDSEGFSFSAENVHFILASNNKFPTEEEARAKESKSPGASAERLVSKAAIGDRLNKYHIDFATWQEQWGYVAYQILNNPYFGDGEFEFTLEERQQMVKFTWDNFDKLNNKSFRCYEGLAQDMLSNPDNYFDKWNSSVHLNISYSKK